MLKDAKISTKIIVGYVLAMLMCLIVGLVGRQAMVKNFEVGRDLGSQQLPGVYGLEEMANGLGVAGTGLLRLAATSVSETKLRKEGYETATKGLRKYQESRRSYELLPQTPAEAKTWLRLTPVLDEWQQGFVYALELEKEKDSLSLGQRDRQLNNGAFAEVVARAHQAELSSRDLRRQARVLLDELTKLNYRLAQQTVTETEIATARSSRLIMAMLLIGMALAAGASTMITRGINRALKGLRRESTQLAEAAVAGQLSARGDVAALPLEFRDIVRGINDILDAVTGPLNVAADYVEKISKGNIPPKITDPYNGDFNTIKNNLNQCIEAVNQLVTDANTLSKAAVEGKLATRADASQHRGDFRKIVQGVNDTLDAVIGPLNVAADYVDKISKGNVPRKITDEYNGDFNTIKHNLNQCIAAVDGLVNDTNMLSRAAVEGKLATRADASKHQGDFRKIVQGVNDTLDAVIGPLNVAADYLDKISKGNVPQRISSNYNGEFNAIKNSLNQCIDAINQLIADTQALSQAAVDGRLATRSDVSQHQGDFRRIVEGVNRTLDAVIDPIMEATQVLESLSHYDLRARVTGNYSGDHARIKTALNGTGQALHDAMTQVAEAVRQVEQASTQIVASSQSVAQGASEQASSLEETSASLEQMSGMTQQNADNTIQARTLARTTKEAAEKGGHAMTRMVDAMEKIRTASEGTAEIIKDINDIAFQTNLLALNAAVEAARAGDAGRGFAVVAEEVRNLALRSKEAAKKTEDLIKMSVGHAENGRVISGEVAGSLTEIVSAASKVNDIVSEIAVASQEQARGIEQVNKAVSEMDKVVQVAAANAEESSGAAEQLTGQSEELTTLVARFQLDSNANPNAIRRGAGSAEQRHRAAPTNRMREGRQTTASVGTNNGSALPDF